MMTLVLRVQNWPKSILRAGYSTGTRMPRAACILVLRHVIIQRHVIVCCAVYESRLPNSTFLELRRENPYGRATSARNSFLTSRLNSHDLVRVAPGCFISVERVENRYGQRAPKPRKPRSERQGDLFEACRRSS